MQILDWVVLIGTISFITIYGIVKTKGQQDLKSYFVSGKMKWYTVGLSIMATQASAITFLSTPGQAFSDGMRFVQFYFGLPLAMVVLSVTVVPIFYKLQVHTAYEFLEKRFDHKTRALAALLFLVQRGLAAGLTIYAPSLILSTLFSWDILYVNWATGGVVILYTVFGGTEAVGHTQKQQMTVILVGMLIAAYMVFSLMPPEVGVLEAVKVAGKMGKLNAIDWTFDLNNRYTVWSGLIGGFFLSLSYFGTDQSQVQRYLGGKSITESRLGLLMNGFIKIPMQFMILFLGTMVFVFYQFNQPPIFFDKVSVQKVYESPQKEEFVKLEKEYAVVFEQKKEKATSLITAFRGQDLEKIQTAKNELQESEKRFENIRGQAVEIIHAQNEKNKEGKASDTNYIFLTFVINYLPAGLVGLLIAVILSASMSSTSSELSALASITIIDIYKRSFKKEASDKHYVLISKLSVLLWGIYAILLAGFANSLSQNLIEAVNILGSLFYGTILGIFLVAFYVKRVGGNAVFFAALLAETVVVLCWQYTQISYLWYNMIGCVLVILLGLLIETVSKSFQKT